MDYDKIPITDTDDIEEGQIYFDHDNDFIYVDSIEESEEYDESPTYYCSFSKSYEKLKEYLETEDEGTDDEEVCSDGLEHDHFESGINEDNLFHIVPITTWKRRLA